MHLQQSTAMGTFCKRLNWFNAAARLPLYQ